MVNFGNKYSNYTVMNFIYDAVCADSDTIAVFLASHFHATEGTRGFRQFDYGAADTGLDIMR